MEWLSSNWIWLALGVGALALFGFGRAGCGMGHGGHDHRRREEGGKFDRPRETSATPLTTPAARLGSDDSALPSTGHLHGGPSANQGELAAGHASHDTDPNQVGRQRHRHGC